MDSKVEALFKRIFDDYLHHEQAIDTSYLEGLVSKRRALAQKLTRLSSPLLETEDVEKEKGNAGEYELKEHKLAVRAIELADNYVGREGSPLRSFRTISGERGETLSAIAEEVESEGLESRTSLSQIAEEESTSNGEPTTDKSGSQLADSGENLEEVPAVSSTTSAPANTFETPVHESQGSKVVGKGSTSGADRVAIDVEGPTENPISPSMSGLTGKDSKLAGVDSTVPNENKSKKQLREEEKAKKKLEKVKWQGCVCLVSL